MTTPLVLPSGRSTGGFRLYTDGDIDRVRLVKQMKPLELLDEARTTCSDAKDSKPAS